MRELNCLANAHELWLKDLEHWRVERRIRVAYDSERYDLPALRWTQSSFIQPQLMVHDVIVSAPGSLACRVSVAADPSLTKPHPPNPSVGGTLLTVTATVLPAA